MGKYSPNIIAECLASCAEHNPDGEAVVYGEQRINWKSLHERVLKMAGALVKLGVNRNDKVAFMFHNTPDFIETNYAIQVAGAVPVPLNYRFTAREIEFQANHCDAVVLIYDSIWREAVEAAAPSLTNIRTFICRGESGIEGALDYDEFVASGSGADPKVPTDWEDVAVMIYTGGTTGFPKGVMLTYGGHRDMYANFLANIVIRVSQINLTPEQAQNFGETLPIPGLSRIIAFTQTGLGKKILSSPLTYRIFHKALDHVLSHPGAARFGYGNTIKYMVPSMPFFHDASYQILILGAFMGNMVYVLVPSIKFDPALILETVQKEQPFFMANVPTGWKKLVSYPELGKYDVSSIKIVASGAGAASVGLKKAMFEKLPGVIIADMFGQTEMTPITTFRIDTDPSTLKERSVGKSIVEARVLDENGKELGPGEVGEIHYRSTTVMKGYYKDEEKTSEVMKDGWFSSGDLGYIDEEGEVRLVDRKKECINTGGEKVFPLEVEEIIHEHPAVEDVCVIGVPDEEWGSTVRAVVQPKKDADVVAEEIIEFCRGRLAGYKIPRSVVFVKELPLSPVGKVLRARIREQYGSP